MTNGELDVISHHSKEQPGNPLYAAAAAKWITGDWDRVESLLLTLYPGNRLPNNQQDWCSEWVIQREMTPKDWQPCQSRGYSEHTGAEFVAIYKLIVGS